MKHNCTTNQAASSVYAAVDLVPIHLDRNEKKQQFLHMYTQYINKLRQPKEERPRTPIAPPLQKQITPTSTLTYVTQSTSRVKRHILPQIHSPTQQQNTTQASMHQCQQQITSNHSCDFQYYLYSLPARIVYHWMSNNFTQMLYSILDLVWNTSGLVSYNCIS